MTINVIGINTTVRDSFKETADKKLSKFNRFFEDSTKADVKVTHESGREAVEITIHSQGMFFRSESTTDDRVKSLDDVVSKLFRQITKNKSRLTAKLRNSAFEEPFPAEYLQDSLVGEDEFRIIKTKQFSLKPMFTEEAILQMNLIGHSFFMFRNADDDEISVVYRRDDGNYGLISPE